MTCFAEHKHLVYNDTGRNQQLLTVPARWVLFSGRRVCDDNMVGAPPYRAERSGRGKVYKLLSEYSGNEVGVAAGS